MNQQKFTPLAYAIQPMRCAKMLLGNYPNWSIARYGLTHTRLWFGHPKLGLSENRIPQNPILPVKSFILTKLKYI